MASTAYIVTDLGYGDSGKGTTVDYLARQSNAPVVIRHNGGAQAGHNVVTPDGRHHTFAQFGSGSFVPNARTHLSAHMLVNPLNMLPEADNLISLGVHDVWERTTISRDCLVITPWHRQANHMREIARGKDRHGSCGQGVGETVWDALDHPELALRINDLWSPDLETKLRDIQSHKAAQVAELFDTKVLRQMPEWHQLRSQDSISSTIAAYDYWLTLAHVVREEYLEILEASADTLIFEGAQGVLLDEWFGFHPYTTWSTTTHSNALRILDDIGFAGDIRRLGVLRSYMTRHGAGPFVTEDARLTRIMSEPHNNTDAWQGAFRVGHLDLVALRYALDVCGGTDELVVTHMDRAKHLDKICVGYRLADVDPALAWTKTNGDVNVLRAGSIDDLERQERLTNLVQSCTPVYESVQTDTYLQTIEQSLGLPVTLVSHGPTAADKRVVSPAI